VTTVLIIAAVIVGYFLFVLASPVTGCRRCRGYGTKGRRRRSCHRCGGTGTRFRLGAPLAYRAISRYRRHRANGNLTLPPLKPPRRRP
jgi:DnaJ-class molecular chaperone